MATLNIVNKSPFEKHTLEQCLQRASDGDGILLIEDGVVAALRGTDYSDKLAASTAQQWYVLEPDLLARGLGGSALIEQCSRVDYTGFVKLVTEYDRVHSWL